MTAVLMALAILAAYLLYAVIRPQKSCGRCNGWGTRGRRRASCPRCGGTGTRFRPGAVLVHRGTALAIRHLRERREARR